MIFHLIRMARLISLYFCFPVISLLVCLISNVTSADCAQEVSDKDSAEQFILSPHITQHLLAREETREPFLQWTEAATWLQSVDIAFYETIAAGLSAKLSEADALITREQFVENLIISALAALNVSIPPAAKEAVQERAILFPQLSGGEAASNEERVAMFLAFTDRQTVSSWWKLASIEKSIRDARDDKATRIPLFRQFQEVPWKTRADFSRILAKEVTCRCELNRLLSFIEHLWYQFCSDRTTDLSLHQTPELYDPIKLKAALEEFTSFYGYSPELVPFLEHYGRIMVLPVRFRKYLGVTIKSEITKHVYRSIRSLALFAESELETRKEDSEPGQVINFPLRSPETSSSKKPTLPKWKQRQKQLLTKSIVETTLAYEDEDEAPELTHQLREKLYAAHSPNPWVYVQFRKGHRAIEMKLGEQKSQTLHTKLSGLLQSLETSNDYRQFPNFTKTAVSEIWEYRPFGNGETVRVFLGKDQGNWYLLEIRDDLKSGSGNKMAIVISWLEKRWRQTPIESVDIVP